MLTLYKLAKWLLQHDRTTYCALRTVKTMQGDKMLPFAREILGFIDYRYKGNPMAAYIKRSEALRILQREFENTGAYRASRYSEVKPIDDEDYKLSLLLSFICANHRFEILSELHDFLHSPSAKAPERLLSVGYGTGYELKLAREILPAWTIDAFDSSPESFDFATDLLRYFNCPPVSLRQELFPLETGDGAVQDKEAFGKIVLCELLEHLEDPAAALLNLRQALHDKGTMFLTMAINIAQEDHIFHYRNVAHARTQVLDCGYRIMQEKVTPSVMLPFDEEERANSFQKGNYICVVAK